MAAALVIGARYAHAHDEREPLVDFAHAKGLWESWLEAMRVDSPEWRAYSGVGWKLGASAEVASGASRIGWAGTLGPLLLREWNIEVPARHEAHLFVDLAFFVPEGVTHRQLEATLAGAGGGELASIELFDVYSGPGTPQGMKSLAFALEFQNPERTLTESDVQAVQEKMVAAVARACGGRLRER
jgi:phenylalanyl-tRNA synthetase beta chain